MAHTLISHLLRIIVIYGRLGERLTTPTARPT